MKKIWYVLSLVVFLLGVTGCEKDEPWGDITNPVEYPIAVPFTEYFLLDAGTSCQWNIEKEKYYPPDPADSSKILIINSADEMGEYITCIDSWETYPEIDFSKKTLVLVCGTSFTGVNGTSSKLLQLSANDYQLDIEVDLHSGGVVELWSAELIVDKISKESKFKLNVTLGKQ